MITEVSMKDVRGVEKEREIVKCADDEVEVAKDVRVRDVLLLR